MNHSAALCQVLTNAAVDAIDAGTTNPTGSIQFLTAADAVIVTCNFSNPAFGNGTSASPSVATANTIANGTVTSTGDVAKFRHINRDGTVVHSGTVTAAGGGGDYIITSVSLTLNEVVSVSGVTYTGPT